MATRAATAKAPPTSNALVKWEEELGKMAVAAAESEANNGGGSFFSMKSGQLSFDGAPLPGNEIGAIIVDHIFENTYYEGVYNSENPAPPVCFAFGRDEATMAPHPAVFEKGQQQNDTCKGCPMNEWGSAPTGKGKACGNKRRLALIPGGSFDKNKEFVPFTTAKDLDAGQMGLMKLPVTSVKAFGNYVKQVAAALRRPPLGVFTHVWLEPNPKTQFSVHFEALDKVPDNLMAKVMEKRTEAAALIDAPYNLDVETPEPPARGRAAPARGRAAAAPARGRKY